MTNIGSYPLPDVEIAPTLKEALAYLEQAIEGINENEGESSDLAQCRLAIPDIQECIRMRETGPISAEPDQAPITI